MKCLSIGEMIVDFLPGESEDMFLRRAGGAPANLAVAVARQECEAGFCGMAGDDDFGRFLLRTLVDNGVTPLVTELTGEAVTTMAFVTLDAQGERSFVFARKPGADMLLEKRHIGHPFFDEADMVHAGSCSLSKGPAAETTVYAMEEGHRRGKMISFDINYREWMWDFDRTAAAAAVGILLPLVDFLKFSEEEADMVGCAAETDFFDFLREKHIAVAVETRGAAGARCFWNGRIIEVSGVPAACVDTTGAGDAFWGGFLAALMKAGLKNPAELNEELLLEALRRGNVCGALCVQKKGAVESLPTANETERYMREMYPPV
ncbi:MAG: carbohydrate kinase [Oscillospiraceae bacterium]|nr:carbohydrate kinase [Oscillospiraceae bacterium]